MILSSSAILKVITDNLIAIEPFNDEAIDAGAYVFTLDSDIRIPVWPKIIDCRSPNLEFTSVKITDKGFPLEPGQFILGRTHEQVMLSDRIGCFLDTRTSHARIGLNVLQASTFIEPGQSLIHQTLEITNVGKSTIVLFPGTRIVKGIFFSVEQ